MNTIPIPPGLETRIFVLEENALHHIPAVLNSYWGGKRPWIVCDENTWKAAGKSVYEIVCSLDPFDPLILPGTPKVHPDWSLACELEKKMPEDCVPLAVGSGVINDLIKTASGIRKCTYCCVPTAASVDGYTSSGAALSVNGLKKTVPCPAPLAVVSDTLVLKTAPPEMAVSGYGDLATKIVAGADWIIADIMKADPVRDTWDMVQGDLENRLRDPADLGSIFLGLAATGYAMQKDGDSRPASGAEHLLSHIWEMEGLSFNGEEVSHGFKVSVGTVITARLMQFVLDTAVEQAVNMAKTALTKEERSAEIARLLVKGCYGSGVEDVAMAKFKEGDAIVQHRNMIYANWETLQAGLKKQFDRFGNIEKLLSDAGCPIRPSEIGLSTEQFIHAVHTAQLIRNRYTILDLLYETGLLDAAVDRMFKDF